MNEEKTFIYVLKDPVTDRIRYLGKANDPRNRLANHKCEKKRSHRANWIQGLKTQGLCPVLEILDCVPRTEWRFWEREYIKVFRALGMDLVNGTDGGDGRFDPSVAEIEKHRKAISGKNNPWFGKPRSEETKEKMRTTPRPNNTSGVIGVSYAKNERKWKAEIMYSGKTTRLGYFHTLQEAAQARKRAEEAISVKKGQVGYL